MDPNLKVSTLRDLWYHADDQHWLPVQGESMSPMLQEGNNILVSYDVSKIKRGDILVYQKADGLVAHRLVKIIHQTNQFKIYITKGDNCTYFDGPLEESDILGVVHSIRKISKEYHLTSFSMQVVNGALARLHLILGTIFTAARHIKLSI